MYDVAIIGAGIVGLAAALRLLQQNPRLKLCLIEKEAEIARHQTGNNSGVIHSGIYYKPGSLKATNCRQGYQQLLDFCRQHDVPHDICGKIIVATNPRELPALETIHQRGQANGLQNLRRLSPREMRTIEPHVAGIEALFVPQAGIVHYPTVATRYADLIRAAGGTIHLNERLLKLHQQNHTTTLVTNVTTRHAHLVVNCAGLYADRIARMTHPDLDLKIIPFRGEYYQLTPKREHLVRHLIYPVPNPAFPFLGVHFTRMIQGGVEAGPNAVLALRREGYRKTDLHPAEAFETLTYPGFLRIAARYWRDGLGEIHRSCSKRAFVRALQQLIPEIQTRDLLPGGAGVRAQACNRAGQLMDDFVIVKSPTILHVCNAPSPAATSSLAIGTSIANHILQHHA